MVDTPTTTCDLVRSDITIYETSGRRGVFITRSINRYSSLGWDKYGNDVARLTMNVLKKLPTKDQ